MVTSIDLDITGAALYHRLAVCSWSSCLTFLCPISPSNLDNNCWFTSQGFCEAPFVNACDVLFIVKDINNHILKMLSTSPAFWFLPKPLFHLGQTLSFSFTSMKLFYSIIKFNKPICMFGATKSAPSYWLSVTGEAQGKATVFVMPWWQKALLVLRTLCKTLAVAGPVRIFSKLLLLSEGQLLGWQYTIYPA